MATHLCFYTERLQLDQKTLIKALFEIFQADKACNVFKSNGESREWDAWSSAETLIAVTPHLSYVDTSDLSSIDGLVDTETLIRYYSEKNNEYVSFALNSYDRSDRIALSLSEFIPESIRDDFDPRSVEFSVGPRDIFETSDPDNPTYIARALFSMDFCDNGDTYSPDKYHEMALLNKEFRKLISEVEAFSGPLKSCIYWGVH